jgi:alcohol dehydrogenase class IV
MARYKLTTLGLDHAMWGATDMIVGMGALDAMPRFWTGESSRPSRIALLAGRESMRRNGVLDRVEALLGDVAPVVTLEGIPSNPSPSDAQRAADFLSAEQPDALVAIGGGSVLDVAKVANCVAFTGGTVATVLTQGDVRGRLVPCFVAIPTTAGTGSEITSFATIWDTTRKRKLSLDTPYNRSSVAIVDPALTLSTPPHVTRQCAADALGHALESLWSRRRTVLSEAYAMAAIDLIVPALPDVLVDPSSLDGRAALHRGALFAGLAIAISHTAAAHALSYSLTLHHGVPHGFAVAELLPGVCEANLPALPPHIVGYLERVFTAERASLSSALQAYLRRNELLQGLCSFGVTGECVDDLLATVPVPERLRNNLVPLDAPAIRTILVNALGCE